MKTFLPALALLALASTPLSAAPQEGNLVQGSRPAVYLIKDGKRCVFGSPKMVTELGFKFEDVIKLSDEELDAIPLGRELTLPYKKPVDGDLVRGIDLVPYLIKDGKRCAINSQNVFRFLQLNPNNIISISKGDMNLIPKGETLTMPIVPYKEPRNGDIIKGSGDAVYLIKDGKRCPIESSDMFDQLGLQWDKIINISDADLEALPEGSL
jgi:hypothetical protein